MENKCTHSETSQLFYWCLFDTYIDSFLQLFVYAIILMMLLCHSYADNKRQKLVLIIKSILKTVF